MDKLKFWLLALLATATCLTFTACSDDDDEPAAQIPAELIGTWEFQEYGGPDDIYSLWITFHKNGTFLWESEDYTGGPISTSNDEGTFTVSGNTITMTCTAILGDEDYFEHVGEVATFSYSVRRDVLIFDGDRFTREK